MKYSILIIILLWSCNQSEKSGAQTIQSDSTASEKEDTINHVKYSELMPIQNHFNSIVTSQKKLKYEFPSLLNPPATSSEIEEIEKEFGFKLNQEIIDLYSLNDGTNFYNLPSGKTGIFPIHNWLSLKDALGHYKVQIEFRNDFYNQDTKYSPGKNMFPFLSDGSGNFFWVDLNEGGHHGQIYWTNTFGDQPDYVCNSLTEFFKDIDEAYLNKTFFLDEDGHLDCDYNVWKY